MIFIIISLLYIFLLDLFGSSSYFYPLCQYLKCIWDHKASLKERVFLWTLKKYVLDASRCVYFKEEKTEMCLKCGAYTTNLVQFGHEVQETKMDKTILRNPSHSLESCSDNKKVCCIQKLVRLRPFDYRGALFRSSLPSGAVLYYKHHVNQYVVKKARNLST